MHTVYRGTQKLIRQWWRVALDDASVCLFCHAGHGWCVMSRTALGHSIYVSYTRPRLERYALHLVWCQ